MTKLERTALAQAQLEAYNRHDLNAFCACYHPEVKVVSLADDRVISHGIDEFREKYRIRFSSSPELRCELKSRIVLEASVIDEELVSGSSGTTGTSHVVAIYGFRDGLIDRVWFQR